jgi:predicted permease
MLPLEAIAGLNSFVLFFALPCMLYRFGSSTPLAQLLDAGVLFTWTLCALITVGFTLAVSRKPPMGWNDASFGALVAAFPNTGFMGVPLLVALLGPKAAGPVILTLLIDMVITTSLCIALSRLDAADQHSASKAAANALKGVASNPLPWSILLGALSSAVNLKLPQPVLQTVGLLADAASPVALFTIGAVLARSQILAASNKHAPIALRDYVPVAAIKLLLHPLLVLLMGAAAIALGLPLSPFARNVMVLAAALPSASNVALLAERFGADNGRIARIILLSTATAFLTFSLTVSLLM